jgi:hypothetical protein
MHRAYLMQRNGLGVSMIDFQTPRFSGAQVAAACETPAPTFRTYFARGHFRVVGDARQREGNGLPNFFSLRDATGFAVACRLLATTRIEAKRAFEIGVVGFGHTGGAGREPGFVFNYHQFGETYLIYHPDTGRHEIVVDEFFSIEDLQLRSTPAVSVLALNVVMANVFHSLGLDRRVGFEGSSPVADPSINPNQGRFVG